MGSNSLFLFQVKESSSLESYTKMVYPIGALKLFLLEGRECSKGGWFYSNLSSHKKKKKVDWVNSYEWFQDSDCMMCWLYHSIFDFRWKALSVTISGEVKFKVLKVRFWFCLRKIYLAVKDSEGGEQLIRHNVEM